MPRTRAQRDAERAMKDVDEALAQIQSDKERKRYGMLVHRFPVMVRENGLIAAFGFLHSKAGGNGEAPEGRLAAQMGAALGLEGEPAAVEQHLAGLELAPYLHLTRRVLELSVWYRRMVEARLGEVARG